MKKYIKMGIKWSLPDNTEKIITQYVLSVPQGITPSYYLWISTGRRLPYKTQCFVNRLLNKKEYLFKNK